MRRIIIFSFIFLVIIAIGVWFYKNHQKNLSLETPITGFKSFFPIGDNITDGTPGGTLPINSNSNSNQNISKYKFSQISSGPVAGFVHYLETYKISKPPADLKEKPIIETVTDNVVRYVSRNSGFVYEKRNDDTPIQVSNIFIPNIYEAFFLDNYSSAMLRFLREDDRTIATYTLPIPNKNPDGKRTQKNGVYLPDNILNVSVSPDQTEINQIFINNSYGTSLTSNSINENKKELVRTPFHEWLSQWTDKNTLYLQTKASYSAEGFLYKIDRNERKLRRVLGNINGLTTSVSPSGKYILYSESGQNNFVTRIYNTKNNSTITLSLKILPEKCFWLKDEDLICAGNNEVVNASYPDSWYAGLIHFSDKIFKIYTSNNTFDILYDGQNNNFDMTNISVNEENNTYYFIDKSTGLLWKYTPFI